MSGRERKASGGATAVLSAPSSATSRAEVGERLAPVIWEEWFRFASTSQQAEALNLAHRQGFLYSHQLPPVADGTVRTKIEPSIGVLQQVLAGKVDELATFRPPTVDFVDRTLTAVQQSAVARALSSPDLCLVQHDSPTSFAGTVAELITQEVKRGQRVLFLARTSATLDRVLERLAEGNQVLPMRFLAPGEPALSPALTNFSLDEQRNAFRDRTFACAQRAQDESEQRSRKRQAEEACWPTLRELAEKIPGTSARVEEIRRRLEHLAGEVEAEAIAMPASGRVPTLGPFASELIEILKKGTQRQDELDRDCRVYEEQRANLELERIRLELQIAEIRPLAEAKQSGRWWTLPWWKATFNSGRLAELTSMNLKLDRLKADAAAALDAVHGLRTQINAAADASKAEKEDLIRQEIGRRQREWQSQLGDFETELLSQQRQWSETVAALEWEGCRPVEPSPAAVARAENDWRSLRGKDDESCLFARQWANFLRESVPHFLTKLPEFAQVLVGTMSALQRNPDFARGVEQGCDVLLLADAEQLYENDLLPVARKARRWVLLGAARQGIFQRLWQPLQASTSCVGYHWIKERDRWCCRLKAVGEKDRRYLESERLVDFPEIELRILAMPRTRPCVAQVVFPSEMDLAQAKQFIYRELQEAALQVRPGRARWIEGEGHITLHFGAHTDEMQQTNELDRGVREGLNGAQTCCIRFAKDEGWTWPLAEDWCKRYLNFRDLGRTFDFSA